MSVKQVCSLCRNTCREYNSLQTYIDEFYKIYDITVKYFDPMLFTQDESTSSDHNPVLCRNCWFHIHEFYEFQQQVLETRMLWEDKSHSKTLILDVKQEVIQENMPTSNTPDNGSLSKSKADADNMFENNLENEDLETESLTSCEKTLDPKLKPQVIQVNVPTSNAQDNGSLGQSEADANNQFENNLEIEDMETESLTNCEKTIASKLNPPVIQADVPTSIRSDIGNLDTSEDDEDNILECSSQTKSPTSCENAIESQQTKEKDEENSLALEEDINQDEDCLPTKRKLRQRTTINKNDTSPPERIKKPNAKGSSNFKIERARQSDALIAQWKSEFICDLCSEIVTNFDNMRSHFKKKHETRSYIKCCARKLYRRCDLVNHARLHLNPDAHKCDICGKASTTKQNLQIHKKAVHEVSEKLKCNICEKLLKRKESLELHMLTHSTKSKDFICSECGKCYLTKQLLNSHIRYVHHHYRVCGQCGKTIHGKHAFKKHRMEHAGVERPKFPCDVCGIELMSATSLKYHKNAYHNDGSTIYVCSVCGKVAASQNALRKHKKLAHETERTHKCTYCDKAFKLPYTLREHIAGHTGEDLYKCPNCPQTFKVNANMHKHRKRVHPVEWQEARKNRPQHPKINNQVKKHIAIL